MVDPKDEQWLKRVFADCVKNIPDSTKKKKDLEWFRTFVVSLVKDIEKKIDETWALWELEPESKEVGEKFYLLDHSLFYLRRFCQGKMKGRYQKE